MFITRRGEEKARQRLLILIEQERIKREDANDLYNSAGDQWHDNPAWMQATQEYEALQRVIDHLRGELEMPKEYIEDLGLDYSTVHVGAEVHISYVDGTHPDATWAILGPLESDVEHGVISTNAPIAIALMGKKTGDVVAVNGRKITIVSIKRWPGLGDETEAS